MKYDSAQKRWKFYKERILRRFARMEVLKVRMGFKEIGLSIMSALLELFRVWRQSLLEQLRSSVGEIRADLTLEATDP